MACLLGCVASAGCAPGNRAGQLVIIGGGLRPDNGPIYERVFAFVRDEGLIGILPTASGVPETSGLATATDLLARATGQSVCVINLTTRNPQFADTPACAANILHCDALWFTGGDQSRIVEAFRPQGRDTAGYLATRTILREGGLVAGTSAGAAMMCDPMIYGGNSARALCEGASLAGQPKRGVVIGPGMGLFPYGMIDQHTLRRGRFARLMVAMHAAGVRFGFAVAENSAIHVDLATHRITAMGTDSLLLVDLSRARHKDDAWTDVRLSLLGDGDTVDGVSGRVTPAPRRVQRHRPADSTPSTRPSPLMQDMFAPETLRTALHEAARTDAATRSIASHGFEFVFSADRRSGHWVAPDGTNDEGTADACITDIRLDITPVVGKGDGSPESALEPSPPGRADRSL